MVAIVVIAHQPLASALVAAAQHVYSRDPCAASRELVGFDVPPEADASASLVQAKALLQRVDKGRGVLVLTDIPGATPGNVAARLAQPGQVAVLAGVNMPMLLRALCYGEMSLDELVGKALAGGTGGIQNLAPTTPVDPTQKAR